MKTKKPLSGLQSTIVKAFEISDTDYDVAVIYMSAYGYPGSLTAREMQQKLAPNFKKINDKLIKCRIEPGAAKRTYRLNTKGV